MHFHHLEHQSTHYHFTGHPSAHSRSLVLMYSQPLVLFLKMKKKKKKEKRKIFFSLLKDFSQKKPAEKKGFHEEQYFFFFLWDFFFFFALFFLPHIFSPLKRTQDDGGFILYTLSGCASALDPSNQPTHSILEGTLWTHHLVVK